MTILMKINTPGYEFFLRSLLCIYFFERYFRLDKVKKSRKSEGFFTGMIYLNTTIKLYTWVIS